ncbi:MAG: hypothetical protein KJ630_06250 [Proteobacteria bacterium]|nr:hypothetical protein [Pseudomonadota bacterium]
MKDSANIHLKVQELCDCFATTDPLKGMSDIGRTPEEDEAALKWIALAVLHGINSNAEKISLTSTRDGKVKVTAEYRQGELPAPDSAVARKVVEAIRAMTHIEKDKEKTVLAFGIGNNSMDLKIKSRHEGGDDRITIGFP